MLRRNLLVEKFERTYSPNLPPEQNTFAWHLLHAEAPKHVLEAALVFARAQAKATGGFAGDAHRHPGGGGHAHTELDDLGDRADGEAAPERGSPGPLEPIVPSSAVWTCSCGTANPHAAPLCAGAGCRQTHCSLCHGLGHPSVFCRRDKAALRLWGPKPQPVLPPWQRLPPFSGPLNALEWADRVFGFYYKGSNSFWIHKKRAMLAADVLALLDDDGVLR
jgi:hypothetical protein